MRQIFSPALATLAVFTVLAAAPPVARAQEAIASPWLDFREAKVRLIAAKTDARNTVLVAGLEVRLAPGFKTYWRTAGDSGVPPLFDFSQSTGFEAIEVHYPFPVSFDDGAGGKAWGYTRDIVLPVSGRRLDPAAVINLKLDFAVCGTMCIPLSGALTLDPAKAAALSAPEAQALDLARLALPTVLAEDASPALKIRRLTPADPPLWHVRLPFRGEAAAFAAFPEARGFLEITEVMPDGDGFVRVTIAGQAAPGAGGRFGPVRLTYGKSGAAFERMIDLDGAASSP